MLPDFLVAGPPKCASTSLHFYLNQHPEIFMSPEKEINFFNRHYHKGFDFYSSHFKNAAPGQKIGEATPEYAFLPFASDRIKKDLPDVKIILCFRNPVERAFSDWLMLWDAGVEIDDFKTCIDFNLKQMETISFDGEKGAQVWFDRVNHLHQGEKWVRSYLQAGMNGSILEDYLSKFSQNQVKYIFMDDLVSHVDETLKDLFRFLQVDEQFVVPDKDEKNFYYDRKAYRSLIKIIGVKPARRIAHLMPDNLKNVFKQKKSQVKKKWVLEDAERKRLKDIFKPDIQKLEHLTGRNLKHWYE
ncbi:MAG: sulfotransferase [Bacteroidetes bacterium]|nr:sulfotransferase [Bacteroidota bacterium]